MRQSSLFRLASRGPILLAAASASFIALPFVSEAYQPIPSSEFRNPELAEYVTGIAWNNRTNAIGSGAVVSHPKVLLSCAHIVFDNARLAWPAANQIHFSHAHHSQQLSGRSVTLRTYVRFGSYASAVRRHTVRSLQAYHRDVVAGVSFSNLANGYALGHFGKTSSAALTNPSYAKKVLGYPTSVSKNGYMHRLNFRGSFLKVHGGYYETKGVGSFGGNSGGPLLAYDPANRQWFVAGVVVSGLRDVLGVRTLDSSTSSMLSKARRMAGK